MHEEKIKRQVPKVAASEILVINKEKKSTLKMFSLVSEVYRKYFVTGAKRFSAFCTATLVRGLGVRGSFGERVRTGIFHTI